MPQSAVAVLAGASAVHTPPLPAELAAVIDAPLQPLRGPDALPDGAMVAAPDPAAHQLAVRFPDAATVPARASLRARAIGAEVAALAEVALRLRAECPWDREQTPETIVPHTIEEAFEVAEAVATGDAAHLADELGDLLFQSVFLAGLAEEDGESDLAAVARGQADKLISRHPHVYGDAEARVAGEVVDLWERRKREERADQGIFHDLPAGLPALAFATKAQKRAASVGFEFPDAAAALRSLVEEVGELGAEPGARELGDVLFAAVAVGRAVGADPELALRGAAGRFRERVTEAERRAAAAGQEFASLPPEEQLAWYRAARDIP